MPFNGRLIVPRETAPKGAKVNKMFKYHTKLEKTLVIGGWSVMAVYMAAGLVALAAVLGFEPAQQILLGLVSWKWGSLSTGMRSGSGRIIARTIGAGA